MRLRPFALVVVAGIIVALALFACFLLQIKRQAGLILHPAEDKLADIVEPSTTAHFAAPEGELFKFVIGVRESVVRGSLQGTLTLLRGSDRVYERTFAAESLTECNWLDEVGLKGFIISFQDGSNELDSVLRPGETYEVRISLGERPVSPTSLWLAYLQPFRTYQKSRAAK